jgi:hypothetical protein
MKKISFYGLCLCIAFYSCSSENTEGNGFEPEALTFSTYVGMNSRALEKSSFATGDVIGINAFQKTGNLSGDFTDNFMKDEVLTKNKDGFWEYTIAKFWPLNPSDRISFVATYPNVTPVISTGELSFSFTVASEVASQQDFMWSSIIDAYRNDRNGTSQNGIVESPVTTPIANVPLKFKHALSKITFNAKTADNYGATVKVTDIVLNNLYGAGTYTLSSALGQGSWVATDEQDESYVVLEKGTTALTNSFSTFGSSLLLIPQVLSTTGTKSTVTIKYTVTYTDTTPEITVNEESTFDLATKELSASTWEQNKVYNYKLTVALDMINFEANVDSWGGTEVETGLSVN